MNTATFLACNKEIHNCVYTDIFKACLNCSIAFIKTLQFKQVCFRDHLF